MCYNMKLDISCNKGLIKLKVDCMLLVADIATQLGLKWPLT